MLHRVIGPECPKCGCTDSREIDQSTRWGQTTSRRRCNHCGWVWSSKMSENVEVPNIPEDHQAAEHAPGLAVEYSSVRCRCPVCGATNPKVQSTRPQTERGSKFRQHKCPKCGETFQSREEMMNYE